jgi:outer membrane receptor protein involved in Fe transport
MLCHRTAPRGALAAALLVAATASAEEAAPDLAQLELEDLMALTVSTASKHEQSVSSAPASVSVVTREEIRDLGYRTLADVLSGVRGLFVSYDRNYSYLGFRGFERPGDYNTRILLLVDGHTWNEDIYDMAFVGPELGVDLDLVDRVEVVRGPGSSMYGGNAFFGIVNVITRGAGSFGRGEVAATAGSLGAYGGRASAAFSHASGAEGWLSVSGSDVAGADVNYPDFGSTPSGGWARGRDWERWGSFLAKASYGGVSFQATGMRRDKGIPTGSFGTVFDDPHNETSDRRLFTELRYDGKLDRDLDVTLRGYWDYYTFREGYAYAARQDGAPPALSVDYDRGRWVGAELRTVSRLGRGWLLVAGGEAKYHYLQELRNYALDGSSDLVDRRTTAAASLYAQVEAPLTRWLQMVAGARYDRVGEFTDALSPRLALIVTPLDGTVVKAVYGHGFRAPNDNELHYQDGETAKPPLSLRPETITTYEVAVEQRVGRQAHLGASAYRFQARGLISPVTDPRDGLDTYANTATARGTGLEVEADQRWDSGVALRASWAMQRAEDGDTGARLTNSPTHLGKLVLHGPLGWLGLRGGAEVLYLSSRLTLAGASAPAHALVNLNVVAARLASGALDVSVGLRNVLGTRYGDPGSSEHLQDLIGQDGRSVQLKATWRY